MNREQCDVIIFEVGDFAIYSRPEYSAYSGCIVKIVDGSPTKQWYTVDLSVPYSGRLYVYKDYLKPLTKLHKALI